MNKMTGYTRFESVWQPPQLDTSIQFVPVEQITKEMCMDAVKQNGMNLEYVPKEYLTDEIIHEAIRRNKRACVYAVDRLTDDMVKELRTLGVHVNTRDKSVTLPNT